MRNDIKAVLFDLDGTLLPMENLNLFMEKYFALISEKLKDYGVTGERFLAATVRSMKAMAKNVTERTNRDIFWEYFHEEFGLWESDIKRKLDEFYADEYHSLRALCGFNEDAAKTVRSLKAAGYRVAIATNPLFPADALSQRLEWSGISQSEVEFITTYEEYHSCKPSPLYYNEILKNLGLSAEEVMMVGNDTSDDMSAELAGLKVFLLTDCLINTKGVDITKFDRGSFKELRELLKV